MEISPDVHSRFSAFLLGVAGCIIEYDSLVSKHPKAVEFMENIEKNNINNNNNKTTTTTAMLYNNDGASTSSMLQDILRGSVSTLQEGSCSTVHPQLPSSVSCGPAGFSHRSSSSSSNSVATVVHHHHHQVPQQHQPQQDQNTPSDDAAIDGGDTAKTSNINTSNDAAKPPLCINTPSSSATVAGEGNVGSATATIGVVESNNSSDTTAALFPVTAPTTPFGTTAAAASPTSAFATSSTSTQSSKNPSSSSSSGGGGGGGYFAGHTNNNPTQQLELCTQLHELFAGIEAMMVVMKTLPFKQLMDELNAAMAKDGGDDASETADIENVLATTAAPHASSTAEEGSSSPPLGAASANSSVSLHRALVSCSPPPSLRGVVSNVNKKQQHNSRRGPEEEGDASSPSPSSPLLLLQQQKGGGARTAAMQDGDPLGFSGLQDRTLDENSNTDHESGVDDLSPNALPLQSLDSSVMNRGAGNNNINNSDVRSFGSSISTFQKQLQHSPPSQNHHPHNHRGTPHSFRPASQGTPLIEFGLPAAAAASDVPVFLLSVSNRRGLVSEDDASNNNANANTKNGSGGGGGGGRVVSTNNNTDNTTSNTSNNNRYSSDGAAVMSESFGFASDSGFFAMQAAELQSLALNLNKRSIRFRGHLKKDVDEGGFKVINGHTILEELGRGQYGKVKLAATEDTGEMRAIKIIPKRKLRRRLQKPGSGSSAAGDGGGGVVAAGDNFLREVEVMKKLKHPNIVQLYEVIDDPEAEKVYIVMQYIERGPIVSMSGAATCTALDMSVAQGYMKQIVNAVVYLHHKKICHCDIKPDNILLSAKGLVFLADFGVSGMFDDPDNADDPRATKGTPLFMAPEEWQKKGDEYYSSMHRIRSARATPRQQQQQPGSARSGVESGAASSLLVLGTPMIPQTNNNAENNVNINVTLDQFETATCVVATTTTTTATKKNSKKKSKATLDAFQQVAPYDVWALGMTFYLMVCGKMPFTAKNTDGIRSLQDVAEVVLNGAMDFSVGSIAHPELPTAGAGGMLPDWLLDEDDADDEEDDGELVGGNDENDNDNNSPFSPLYDELDKLMFSDDDDDDDCDDNVRKGGFCKQWNEPGSGNSEPELLMDLLSKMLERDRTKRFTIGQVRKHPYISDKSKRKLEKDAKEKIKAAAAAAATSRRTSRFLAGAMTPKKKGSHVSTTTGLFVVVNGGGGGTDAGADEDSKRNNDPLPAPTTTTASSSSSAATPATAEVQPHHLQSNSSPPHHGRRRSTTRVVEPIETPLGLELLF